MGLCVEGVVEWAGLFAFDAADLVRSDEAVAEIRLGVELDKVRHAVVEAVPEISRAAGFDAGHAEVVAVAREVGLAGHADRGVV